MDKWITTGLVVALVAVIAILGFPALRHLREAPPPLQPPIRLSFDLPAGVEFGSGDDVLDAAISPNEQEVVFVATSDGTARLWRRRIDSDDVQVLRGTAGARLPTWKLTGNVIAFVAGERLKLFNLDGNTVHDVGSAGAGLGATWLLDGSLLFSPSPRSPIRRLLNGAFSDATALRPGDRGHAFPMAVGSSNAFVYIATLTDGQRIVRLVENGKELDLGSTSGHAQMVGDVVFSVRDGVLLAQRLDPETRQRGGDARPLVLDVGTAPSGHSSFAASTRLLLTAPQTKRLWQLTWYTPGNNQGTPTREPGNYWQVRLSPDDSVAAVTETTPLVRTLDVVLVPMSNTGYVEPLTRAVAADSDPVWSPDGQALVFRSLQDGQPHLYTHAARADADDEIVPMSQADETPTDWRGNRVIVHAPGAKGDTDLWTVDPATGARESIVNSPFNETDARLSPDARWVAYVSDESGQADVYAGPWPRGPRVRVSFAGGTRPRWSRDGRSLFFLRRWQIMRADFSASTFTTAEAVLNLPGVRDFDLGHRRDGVLAIMPAEGSAHSTASVVVNWGLLVN